MPGQHIRSKQSVVDHGEVFTGEHEVKAMCDLVKQETECIESCFLEPVCGNRNFLAEVLSRKLAIHYGRSPVDYKRHAIVAPLKSVQGRVVRRQRRRVPGGGAVHPKTNAKYRN